MEKSTAQKIAAGVMNEIGDRGYIDGMGKRLGMLENVDGETLDEMQKTLAKIVIEKSRIISTRKKNDDDVLIIDDVVAEIGTFESDEPRKFIGSDYVYTVKLRWVSKQEVPEGWAPSRLAIPKTGADRNFSCDVYAPRLFPFGDFPPGKLFGQCSCGGPLERYNVDWVWCPACNDQESSDISTLRRLLWMRHGCPRSAFYGDDGEMQCNACAVDFKRVDVSTLESFWQGQTLNTLGVARTEVSNIEKKLAPATQHEATKFLHSLHDRIRAGKAASFDWCERIGLINVRNLVESQAKRIRELEKTLSFYADPGNYRALPGTSQPNLIDGATDGGARARKIMPQHKLAAGKKPQP